MKIKNTKQKIVWGLFLCFVLSSCLSTMGLQIKNKSNHQLNPINNENNIFLEQKVITLNYNFSDPVLEDDDEYIYISVEESDFNHLADGAPVLPVKLDLHEFEFGSEIISIDYETNSPEIMSLKKKLSFGKCSPLGTYMDEDVYGSSNLYPYDWISFHTGGGLLNDKHRTFLSVRIYPARYKPLDDQLLYINQITLTITYKEPKESLLGENTVYDDWIAFVIATD